MTQPRERVLVVDDEPDLAESCAYFLERAGYEARTVESAPDALELLSKEAAKLGEEIRKTLELSRGESPR